MNFKIIITIFTLVNTCTLGAMHKLPPSAIMRLSAHPATNKMASPLALHMALRCMQLVHKHADAAFLSAEQLRNLNNAELGPLIALNLRHKLMRNFRCLTELSEEVTAQLRHPYRRDT